MVHHSSTVDQSRGPEVAGAVAIMTIAAIAVAIASRTRHRSAAGASPTEEDKCAALAAYLREHLSGSDAAIQVVMRLRRTHAGREDARLFAELCQEFDQEREAVRHLLRHLGASTQSAKRLAGSAAGSLLTLTAGGRPGDLSLFRTLEGLAVGVQGKRCMWRALQSLGVEPSATGGRSLVDLESMAVRQWEAIDERRRSLASRTFAARPPASDS